MIRQMTSNVSALSGLVANGQQAIHFVSSTPSIYSVRRVFPNTVGNSVFYRVTFRPQTFDTRSALSRSLAFVQVFLSPLPGPSPYRRDRSIADHTHRPLAQHGLSSRACKRYHGLMHLSDELRPAWLAQLTLTGLCP